MSMTKLQMRTLIESDVIHRSDKTTLINFALDWSKEYIDKSWNFAELQKEEITCTTISCTFATTDVVILTDIITTSIDIPTGTKIIFSTTNTLPTGLSIETDYWCVRQSATTIKVAETHLKAWQGTVIDITGVGVGTHTITAYRERLAKPDSCKFIYSIRLIDGTMSRKLEPLTPRMADLYTPFGQQLSVGRPTQYVEWADWIQLSKIPDDTYIIQIRYYKWQDAFASDAATAEVSHIDDVIIKAACIHIWEMLGEPEQATIMARAVEMALNKSKYVERMKPDLVLKPSMGSVSRSASDKQSDPFSNG